MVRLAIWLGYTSSSWWIERYRTWCTTSHSSHYIFLLPLRTHTFHTPLPHAIYHGHRATIRTAAWCQHRTCFPNTAPTSCFSWLSEAQLKRSGHCTERFHLSNMGAMRTTERPPRHPIATLMDTEQSHAWTAVTTGLLRHLRGMQRERQHTPHILVQIVRSATCATRTSPLPSHSPRRRRAHGSFTTDNMMVCVHTIARPSR